MEMDKTHTKTHTSPLSQKASNPKSLATTGSRGEI